MRGLFITLFLGALSGIGLPGLLGTTEAAGVPDQYRLDTGLASAYLAPASDTSTQEPGSSGNSSADSDLTIEPPSLPLLDFTPNVPNSPKQPLLDQGALGVIDFDVPTGRMSKVDRHVQFFSYHIRDRFEQWLG